MAGCARQRFGLMRSRQPGQGPDHRQQHRQRHHQCPGDGLRAAEFARQLAAHRIAERAGHHGGEQQPVGAVQGARAAQQRKGHHQRTAGERTGPEPPRWPFAPEPRGKDGGRQRQQAGDDGAMRGRHIAHRQRGEQRKADHHARCRDGQPPPLAAARAPGRAQRAGRGQQCQGEQARQHRAGQRHEGGIEFGYRHARERQRLAEDRHADEAEQQAAAFGVVGRVAERQGGGLGHAVLLPNRSAPPPRGGSGGSSSRSG